MTTRTRKSTGRVTPPQQPAETVELIRPDDVIDGDAKVARNEAKSITIRGMTPADDPVTYDLVDEVPGFLLFALGTLADPDGDKNEQASVMTEFINAAIVPDQRAAFRRHVIRAVPIIGLEESKDIIEEMSKKVMGRPTTPSPS